MDYSPPGSSVHGIFQARILEWVAISASRGSSQPRGFELTSTVSPALQASHRWRPRIQSSYLLPPIYAYLYPWERPTRSEQLREDVRWRVGRRWGIGHIKASPTKSDSPQGALVIHFYSQQSSELPSSLSPSSLYHLSGFQALLASSSADRFWQFRCLSLPERDICQKPPLARPSGLCLADASSRIPHVSGRAPAWGLQRWRTCYSKGFLQVINQK